MSFGSRSLNRPTADELERWTVIKSSGCCVCRDELEWFVPTEVHHLLQSGLRISHRATVGLCKPHHQRVNERQFKSRWPNQRLIDLQDKQIGWPRYELPARPQRRRASRCTASERQVKRDPQRLA